ncbi:hypothetical protein OF83DRAFT_1055149 [Amylostereum chailletii]|nr:hypothetical protein OF83DRAFT_1055149 [Amylostereum chailletii]
MTFSTFALSRDDHYRLLTILPTATNKIITAAPARIYHAAFGAPEQEWSYTGLKGVVVFGYDNHVPMNTFDRNTYVTSYWFRLVDLRKGTIVWAHEVREIIEYEAEKPFFHVFGGKSRKFGFRFDEDEDAAIFLQEVTERIVEIPIQKPTPKKSSKSIFSSRGQRHPIKLSTISSPVPDSFVHVAHMGTDEHGYVDSSWNVAPEWTKLLQKLEGYGVDAEMVEENLEFVKGFLAGAEAMRSSPSASGSDTDESLDGYERNGGE